MNTPSRLCLDPLPVHQYVESAIQIRFGYLSPPLAEQLAGIVVCPEMIAHFEKDEAAILRMHLRGFITDAARDRAFRLLVKAIEAEAEGERPNV